MQRGYDEFQHYSDEISVSGFCDICEGPEFIIISFVCLLAIISLFLIKHIKKKELRCATYIVSAVSIFSILKFTKFPSFDILFSAFVICITGFFGYIGIGYIVLGLFKLIKILFDKISKI